jgi:hypothetical protein
MSEQVFHKIHLADIPPSACAACFGQYPDRRHIDFGAFYDGPILPSGADQVGVVGLAVDDLVICEECLKAAAAQLGLGDAEQVEAEKDELAGRVEELSERLAGAMALISAQEKAAEERGKLEAQLRPKRKPRGTSGD